MLPPPPYSLTEVWGRARRSEVGHARLREVVAWLGRMRLLTPEGRRIKPHDDPLSLRAVHVLPTARDFLDGPWDQLDQRWQQYRQLYDLHRAPQLDPYRSLLLHYSPERSLEGALRARVHFGDLNHKLWAARGWASESERWLLEELQEAERAPALRAQSSPHPEALLQALAYLPPSLARLEAAARLAPGAIPEYLAQAVHFPPDCRMISRELAPGLRQALLPPLLGLLQANWRSRMWGLNALGSVGDATCLEAVRALQPSGEVSFGPRPGRCLEEALRGQAERCILARLEQVSAVEDEPSSEANNLQRMGI